MSPISITNKKQTLLFSFFKCIGMVAIFAVMMGCESVKNTDVGDTPIGSVVSGETHNPDAYLERVRQRNAANTAAAGENQIYRGSHEYSNFKSPRSEKRD